VGLTRLVDLWSSVTSSPLFQVMEALSCHSFLPWTSQPNLLLLMPGEACWGAEQVVCDRGRSCWRPGQWLTAVVGRRAWHDL